MPGAEPSIGGPGGAARKVIVAIALVVGGIVVALLSTEVCRRVARNFVCVGTADPPLWRVDPRYGWSHVPGAHGWTFGCVGWRYEWRTYVRINALGSRDRERTYDGPPNTRRILLLGDSVTEAIQVELEETFGARIEGQMRDRGEPTEVLNTGVAAFGTDNELQFFESEGVRYGADLVLLVFNVANDLVENVPELHARMYASAPEMMAPKTYFRLDAEGEVSPHEVARPGFVDSRASASWRDRIEDELYFLRVVHRLIVPSPRPLVSDVDPEIYGMYSPRPGADMTKAWEVTEALLRRLRRDVDRSGARFAVAVVPSREAVSDEAWKNLLSMTPRLDAASHDPAYPVRRIEEFLAREGIPHVELLSPLRAAAAQSGWTGYFAWDPHLDASGHAVVATALTPFVADLLSH